MEIVTELRRRDPTISMPLGFVETGGAENTFLIGDE